MMVLISVFADAIKIVTASLCVSKSSLQDSRSKLQVLLTTTLIPVSTAFTLELKSKIITLIAIFITTILDVV